MRNQFRRMKKYNPRRSSKTIKMNKQKLIDLEHRIKSDIGEFLVLLEEGTSEQIQNTSQKTKTHLLKFGQDMQKIAGEIGGRMPKYVEDFIHSVDHLLRSPTSAAPTTSLWVDGASVNSCFQATQKLEDALGKRRDHIAGVEDLKNT